jgi:hypothetical protein
MHQKIGELLRVLYKKQSWHIAFYWTGWLNTNTFDMNVCGSHQMHKYTYSSLHTPWHLLLPSVYFFFDNI